MHLPQRHLARLRYLHHGEGLTRGARRADASANLGFDGGGRLGYGMGMSHLWNATLILALLNACGGSEQSSGSLDDERAARPDRETPSGAEPEDDIDSNPEQTPATPVDVETDNGLGAGAGMDEPSPSTSESYVTFVDPDSDFSTVEVHDADRQIVHFDAELQAMIWSTNGDAVGGWSTRGSDLSWDRSGVAFRVRFGTEAGERRAYFTETGRGTICNLTITGPESLAINATGELPPVE